MEETSSCPPKWPCHFAFLLAMDRVLLLHIHDRFGIFSIMDFILSHRYIIVSHCFYLHFSSDKWCGKSFHMLIHHLYILPGEISIHVFGLFFNWAVFFLMILKCSLYILDESFIRYVFLKYIFPVCGFTSHFIDVIYYKSEISNLMVSSA